MTDFTALKGLSDCYEGMGMFEEAVKVHSMLIQSCPSQSFFLTTKRFFLYQQCGRDDLALKDTESLVEVTSRDASALSSRSHVHFPIGNLDLCKADVREARSKFTSLSAQASCDSILQDIILIKMAFGTSEEATAPSSLSRNPSFSQFRQALILHRRKQYMEAYRAFTALLVNNPSTMQEMALNELVLDCSGDSLQLAKQFEAALEVLKKAEFSL